jgi:hypothetical protein
MAVYNINNSRRDNAKLYSGVYKTPAADLPPYSKCEKICRNDAESEEKIIKNKKEKKTLDGLVNEFFEEGIDSDKLLIAVLLYTLIKEGADIKLIIALGYILM